MSQKDVIVELLTKNKVMTQSDFSIEMYGDNKVSVNKYHSLLNMSILR